MASFTHNHFANIGALIRAEVTEHGQSEPVSRLAAALASLFAEDNERFKRALFYRDAGLEPPRVRVELTEAEQFFYDNAGYSYDSRTETAEHGRARCAMVLAEAERRLRKEADVRVEWEPDPEPYDGDDGYDGPVWCAYLYDGDELLGSAGGVAILSDCGDLARVQEAELALAYLR